MERIAIVSDIHANLYALRAFLALLTDLGAVKQVLNLGDFVMLGPHPRQVAELVLADGRFVNIAGNHEDNVLRVCEPTGAFGDDLLGHTQWTRQQLGEELVSALGSLPRSRTIDLFGRMALLEHDLPLGPWWPPPHYREDPELDPAGTHSNINPALVLFGHTHRRVFLERRERSFLNPGSLGCTPEAAAFFCLAEYDGACLDFAFRRFSYDTAALRDDFQRMRVPFREQIIAKRYGMK